jgi:hypothetical protein
MVWLWYLRVPICGSRRQQPIAEMMQAGDTNVFDSILAPSYNVASHIMLTVIRLDSDTGQRELAIMR